MKQIENFDKVEATTGVYERPKAGGYVCMITDVEDVQLDERTGKGCYLKISFDIAEGPLSGYYSDANGKFGGSWPRNATLYRSYKQSAAGFFKAFISSVEKSNRGYNWAWDEKTLRGNWVGIVYGEEEYYGTDGSVKTRLNAERTVPVDDIRNGNYTVPAKKTVSGNSGLSDTLSGFRTAPADDDNPFA